MSGASPLKDFARYTSLNVLGMIALSCYILADTFFVSLGLGANGLAALNLAIPIYNFIHGSGLMIGMGGGTRYSILQSQGNRREANKVFTHVLYLAAVLAAFFVAVGLLFAGDIVRLFGGAGNVFTMAQTYLRVILLFSPRLFDEQRAAVLCAQRRRAPALHGGHDWGQPLQRGAGLGVHLPLRHGDFRRGVRHGPGAHHQHGHPLPPTSSGGRTTSTRWPAGPRAARWGRILSSGAPSLVTEASSGIVIIAFNALIMGLEGNTGVAAYGVIANLSLVVIAIYTGIAQGIQPILSRSYGAGDRKSLTAILRYAMMTMVCVSVVIYGAVLACAPQIAAVFNSEGNATLQAIAEQGLRLYFIACPFAGCNVVMAMYFTSIERPLPAHAISLLRGFFIILPMAFLLAAVGQMVGIWLAFPVTECLVALLAVGTVSPQPEESRASLIRSNKKAAPALLPERLSHFA